jgi:hypothetical protein
VEGDVSKMSELLRALSELRNLYEELNQLVRILQNRQNKILATFGEIVAGTLWTRSLNVDEEVKRIREMIAELSRETIVETERRLRKYC